MFDYDDLEEQLPPRQALESSVMSDLDFSSFGEQLRAIAQRGMYEDLPVLVSQALWEEETLPDRVPKVVAAFLGLLREECERGGLRPDAGAALTFALWQLSLSTSLHEVRTKGAPAPGAPCVLLLGFGGSGVEELEPQATWYHGRGFGVVAASPMHWPQALGEKQEAALARELRSALSSGGRLLLHFCSNGGVLKGFTILRSWITGRAPFDGLPRIEDCLAGVVFECAPARPLDPLSGEVLGEPRHGWLPGTGCAAPKEPSAEAQPLPDPIAVAVVEGEVAFYSHVVMGCVGALCKKYAPARSFPLLLGECPRVRDFISGAARYGVCGPPQWAFFAAADEAPVPHADFEDFEGWDQSLERPVPRLFLYSLRDQLVTKDKVEAYVRYSQRYNPKATVLSASTKKAPHCKLWDLELSECASAVSKLLDEACLFGKGGVGRGGG